MTTHRSNSFAQREAQTKILEWLSSPASGLGLPSLVEDRKVELPGGQAVVVDGSSRDGNPPVFVEVYARASAIKGSGFHKIAREILKLRLLRELYPEAILVIALASEEPAGETAGIQIIAAKLSEEDVENLRSAQRRQRMTNEPGGDGS